MKANPKDPVPASSQVTAEQVIAAYIVTRDRKAELKKAYEAEVAVLDALQDKRAKWLLTEMNRLGTKGFKAESGTCSIDYKDSATVSDRIAYLAWVHEDWEARQAFLDSRVNKTAVKTKLEEYTERKKALEAEGFAAEAVAAVLAKEFGSPLPPGVNYTKITDVKIRRK